MISQLNRNGFCMCGCGGKTSLSKVNDPARGRVIGQPFKFIHGHNAKTPFESHYMEEPMSGCFLWIGVLDTNGYGRVWWKWKTTLAHRVSWEIVNGKIPDGLVIDHLCRTPSCVNPRHMEVVTQRVNVLRGNGPCAIRARWTQCQKCGGAYSNYKTRRFCRKCTNESRRLWYFKNRRTTELTGRVK